MSRKRSFAQETCVRSVGKVLHRTGAIWPGCRIGVAASGGVDSFVLLKCLQIRQTILPFPIEIMAIHLNPGFAPDNHAPLVEWLAKEGIPGHLEVTDYGPVAHSPENRRRSACFLCAMKRRKRLFELCAEYGLTHVAFGHNADDLVETFFMNLCRGGRVQGLNPCEPFFSGKIVVVRPIIAVEKTYIKAAARQWNLPVFSNPCPSAGHTSRSDMAETLRNFYGIAKDTRQCIFNGLIRWQMDAASRDGGPWEGRARTVRSGPLMGDDGAADDFPDGPA
ncbi:MAG: tRNA 2-thiocytidine biosynthesis TtcA family protein [Desulfovibrio sp.]|jgi:tRNA(Ile)-lysidine synthase TilS/MesJ|nr:tRNA 2-thiocytidine biosynthesis TtcA family protein [Desulfovibrio sp.]